MTKNGKPDIAVILTRRMFNTLIYILTQFIGSENEIGATTLSENSARLKFKILKFARAYKNGNVDCVAVNLFNREAAMLTEILISFFSIGKFGIEDYYAQLKGLGIPNGGADNPNKPQ